MTQQLLITSAFMVLLCVFWLFVGFRMGKSVGYSRVYNNGFRRGLERQRAEQGESMKLMENYQQRVDKWMMECFSMEIARDKMERYQRFLEEALELVQSLGCTQTEAHLLVEYAFGRKAGEPIQELGGVMVTAAALASANDLDMAGAAELELGRVWRDIDVIRKKQAAKPRHSPLPE